MLPIQSGSLRESKSCYDIFSMESDRIPDDNQTSGVGREVGPSAEDYRRLAEFRFRLRRFLHFSEEAARANGIEPQQHQLLLAIQGLPAGARPTVSTLSERLCLKHHSTVELVDRLEKQGAVARRPGDEDRREVFVDLTRVGEAYLERITVAVWEELGMAGTLLAASLDSLMTCIAQSRRRS
jgi:DNA-binding MarR family transcriptional regulator